VVVDARWNSMGEQQRLDKSRGLFELARDSEGASSVVVRNQQGIDVAQATETGARLLP